jgi:uncharacterized membrane protein YgcG
MNFALLAAVVVGAIALGTRPAQAHGALHPAGHVSVYAPVPHLVLPLLRASYYGGDLVVFYDAGYWWTIVDDRLYVTYQDGEQWLLYQPYMVTTVRPHFTYGYAYADACYAGHGHACRQWYNQVRYDVRYRPLYRDAQRRYWVERERNLPRRPSGYTRTVAYNGHDQRSHDRGRPVNQGNRGNNGNHNGWGQGNGGGQGHNGAGGNNGNHNGWTNGNGNNGNGNAGGNGHGRGNGRGNGRGR